MFLHVSRRAPCLFFLFAESLGGLFKKKKRQGNGARMRQVYGQRNSYSAQPGESITEYIYSMRFTTGASFLEIR